MNALSGSRQYPEAKPKTLRSWNDDKGPGIHHPYVNVKI